MPSPAPPLLNLSVDPRARLVLFDIADDPAYVAMEVQVFDDDVQGHGVLVLLARQDGRIEVYAERQLNVPQRRFAVGRGIEAWHEAVIDPARVEIHPDGIVVDVGLEDGNGRRIAVRIDDRDGTPRRRSTLLAPVSSGVEHPEQLLVVLLEQFDLVRTGGSEPSLVIGGVPRTITPFPGPARLHHRRFIRYAAAPLIVAVNEAHEGPLDPGSLGPVASVTADAGARHVALRFDPPVPDLTALAAGGAAAGAWWLDVASEPSLLSGSWSAARTGDTVKLEMAVTEPWHPRALPLSLRLVTSVAKVFREWPMSYRWHADVDLAGPVPTSSAGWVRVTGPNRENAYAVPKVNARRLLLAGGLAAIAVAAIAGLARTWRTRSDRG